MLTVVQMSSDAESEVYEPTYRERDVDYTLEDHEQRISRLEKVALMVVGYGLAEGSQLITDVAQFI